MGAVYEAYQESMHRRVALKVLDGSALPSSSEVSRFEREAWIGGRLSHPNIVKVYGQGSEGSTRFIAMELIEGRSLHAEIQRLRSLGTISSREEGERIRHTVGLFIGAADAIVHVHERGIVHRDIKPGNLLLTGDRARLLITDFGLARDAEASGLTQRGDFMGTLRYMSPEQLLAHRVRVDHPTDIWSLGISLYEALTLEYPYDGESEEAYIAAISQKEPAPARSRRRSIPRDVETILMKCLEREPARRYAAAELRDDLRRYLEDRPVIARRPGPVRRALRFVHRERKALLFSAAAALVAVAISTRIASRSRERAEADRIRRTLESALTTSADPASLDPDWQALSSRLRDLVSRDPKAELASLARRAAARVKATVYPPFGLLGDPPDLWFGLEQRFDFGEESLVLLELLGSLDGGPWGSLAWATDRVDGVECHAALTRYLGSNTLSAAPHKVELTAKLTWLARAPTDASVIMECSVGEPDEPWRSLREQDVIAQDTRPLPPVVVSIFKEYPSDFPPRVESPEASAIVASGFKVDKVRLVQVRRPPGRGTLIEYGEGNLGATICIPSDVDRRGAAGFLAEISMEGDFDVGIAVPLAAQATVYSEGDAVVTLPLALGADRSRLGEEAWPYGPASPFLDLYREPLRRHFLGNEVVVGRTRLMPEGTSSGRLELRPSRSVALGTRRFDRYFGRRLDLPVSVEILTVDGRRIGQCGRGPRGLEWARPFDPTRSGR